MNENTLRVEMGIPLLAHPKHTYSKIGGQTDSESEYSSNSEDELDNLIQYSKQVESNLAKNSKPDQDFDQFMNSLDDFETFDDLEDWSDNVDLFMGAMANPLEQANAL